MIRTVFLSSSENLVSSPSKSLWRRQTRRWPLSLGIKFYRKSSNSRLPQIRDTNHFGGVIRRIIDESQQLMRKAFRIADVMVLLNRCVGKRVIVRKLYMVHMPFTLCSDSLSHPTKTGFMTFKSCDLSCGVYFIGAVIEFLHKSVCKFSL